MRIEGYGELGRRPKPLLLAYLLVKVDTPPADRADLESHIAQFAETGKYTLVHVSVGIQGVSDLLALQELLELTHRCGARAVLVVGPSRAALVALQGLRGVHVLTLASVKHGRP